jgi:hypothetical protein
MDLLYSVGVGVNLIMIHSSSNQDSACSERPRGSQSKKILESTVEDVTASEKNYEVLYMITRVATTHGYGIGGDFYHI